MISEFLFVNIESNDFEEKNYFETCKIIVIMIQ